MDRTEQISALEHGHWGELKMQLSDFKPGDRVRLRTWMRGPRYGDVILVSTDKVYVKLDHSAKVVRFDPELILEIVESVGGFRRLNPDLLLTVVPR